MRGDAGATTPHDALFFYYGQKLNCVRSGSWKLHLPHGYRTLNGRTGRDDGIPIPYDQAFTDWALYNLGQDAEEKVNLYDQHPEVAERLKGYADTMIRQLGDVGKDGLENRPPGYVRGFVPVKGEITHLAKRARIEVAEPFTSYTQGGDSALIDGITGSMMLNVGAWMGIEGGGIWMPRSVLISCFHIVGANRGVCPSGHPGEGKKAWIFADEIIVH